MKKLLSLIILVGATAGASAQQTQRLEYVLPYELKTESLRLSCERADVGRGVGLCTERTILHVMNGPRNLRKAQYECSVTWELEKDDNKIDFLDIVSREEVVLHEGNGRAAFEAQRYVGAASDPVKRIRRSMARCYQAID